LSFPPYFIRFANHWEVKGMTRLRTIGRRIGKSPKVVLLALALMLTLGLPASASERGTPPSVGAAYHQNPGPGNHNHHPGQGHTLRIHTMRAWRVLHHHHTVTHPFRS
jgi:hypothetical protein